MSAGGPDARRIDNRADLARELRLLLARAAHGTGRPRVSLAELTKRLGLPPTSKSTVHSYVTGKTLVPAELLDAMVIALGATATEQPAWSEAWYRVSVAPRPADKQPSPTEPDGKQVPRRTARWVAAVAAAVVALAGGLLAGRSATPEAVGVHTIGDDYPAQDEFLAKVLNHATGRCLSRNGAFTHPGNSERIGENIYQWDCAGSDNPGHRLVFAPLSTGWQIRSSIRIDLCFAADGAPGNDGHFQLCQPQDDRQQWRLRVVDGRSDLVVIENRNTAMCLAHLGGVPHNADQILQAACAQDSGNAEWTIERYPPPGGQNCADHPESRVRNHETGFEIGDTDSATVRDSGAPISLAVAGRSAQGCLMRIIGPAARCLTAPQAEAATGVLWLPCDDKQAQQWVVEQLGQAGGRLWTRISASADVSRCLKPAAASTGASVVTSLCNGQWSQQWAFS